MLLRSASTPILGSLLPTSSHFLLTDSPVSLHNHNHAFPVLCHVSSPAVSEVSNHSNSSFIRRTLSDGNLCSIQADHLDEYHNMTSSHRPSPVLEAIPSVYDSDFDESEETAEQKGYSAGSFLDENTSVGTMGPPLFLARGLGIDRIGSGLLNAGSDFSGGDGNSNGQGCGGKDCLVAADNGGNQSDLELHYKRMVEENPTDALFLRNYALFLYQVKKDVQRAEEYYSRAILADPSDGETLSKYASLIWEMYHDEERASSYFEQAVQASPENSYVLAAQAGFLWDIDEADGAEEERGSEVHNFSGFASHVREMVSAS